jgi:hypothetical protein
MNFKFLLKWYHKANHTRAFIRKQAPTHKLKITYNIVNCGWLNDFKVDAIASIYIHIYIHNSHYMK